MHAYLDAPLRPSGAHGLHNITATREVSAAHISLTKVSIICTMRTIL